MKLYTEEQVRKALDLYRSPIRPLVQQVLEKLTPIELPSDGEIKSELRKIAVGDVMDENGEFIKSTIGVDDNIMWAIRGAKWMKDKIQGGNK